MLLFSRVVWPEPGDAGRPPTMECAEVIEAALGPDDVDLGDGTWLESYALELVQPATLSVLMTTEGFRPYVILTDDEAETLAEGEPPLIEILPAGNYLVFANNLNPLPPAQYPFALSVSCSTAEATTIGCGDTIAGQLEPSDDEFLLDTWIDRLVLAIDTPVRVRFRLEGEIPDGVVLVRDSEGADLGSGFDEHVVELVPGDYTVGVNNFLPVPDDVYPYRLTMSCDEATCPGDCDGDGMVSIAELVRGVRIALGDQGRSCPALDLDGDGEVSISELIAAVRSALDGCAQASARSLLQ